MKQKNKTIYSFQLKTLISGLFVFLLSVSIFIAGTAQAQTAAQGTNCASYSQCGANQTCFLTQGAASPTCQPGTLGLPCSSDNNCIVGLTCSSGECTLPSGTSTLAPTTPNSTTGGCPAGLSPKNGLCLPTNPQFSTGLASQSSLTGLLLMVIQFLLTFAGIVSVVVLIIGGFWYITSAGNDEQAEKGKKAIINAIIGLVVVVLAFAIVSIISGTLTTTNFLQ